MSRAGLVLLLLAAAVPVRADDHFEKHVRPLLAEHCVGCHGPEKQKGGLRLDSKAGWQTGGDAGPAVVPGNPDASLLLKAVRGADGVERMPPKGKLPDAAIAALTKWVKDGAPDPRVGGATASGAMTIEAGKKWWAFQPVKRPPVPGSGNPIDAFLLAKLRAKGQSFAPPADRRTLLRRATYDLTGLPPTAEEVEAFEKDTAPDAFAKVVERLLGSPHYGERWGRHWLDLVRYADTAGENSDHPLPHAWRYRNWVVDAVNADVPYDRFVREQLAGDILAARGPATEYAPRIVATGFLAMARRFDHDSDKSMHLTHEDGIDTLGKALLGLTIGCARCHDHKYDPVSVRDYYALYGILDSSKFSFPGCEAKQQPRDMVPLLPPAEWDRVVKPHREKLAALDAEQRAIVAEQEARGNAVQATFAKSRLAVGAGESPDGGEAAFGTRAVEVKAGDLLLLSVTPLKNHGADTTQIEFDVEDTTGGRKWSAAAELADDLLAGNPHGRAQTWWFFDLRTRPTLLPEAVRDVNGKAGLFAWRNGDTPSVLVNSTKAAAKAWTELPPRSLFVHPAANGNVGVGWLSPVSGTVRITGRVKDAHPGGPDGVGWVLERFATGPDLAALPALAERRRAIEPRRAELMRTAPRQDVAFAVVEGTPADAKVHLRGDPEKPGPVVPRRWLEVLGGQPITPNAGSGRLDLAGWVASADNPLTARVMANRVWLHHFGQGIVRTPNDFGTRGAAPTHPALLDWLAAEFVSGGWSLKALHRKIMLSTAYQQSAAAAPNELFAGVERRRLTAEELRDSLLAVGGNLDRTPAGPHPFPPESAWGYTQHTPFGTFFDTDRRSVYLVGVRNRRHPFLGLFDGADPNATTPQRQTTTVPTQALYFLNDPFFHAQADRVAARVTSGDEAGRVDRLFRVVLQRPPSVADRTFAAGFVERYRRSADDRAAWAALARVLLASNEFLYVD
ncbi:PSD1 and planctomycete cytochrome C domain-containing protein [Urbifossiella limnaea]|uniref:Planctomycete cytochrome C n=1 Tax=Urbifossiella limnaea TaxID=2528023 RepID=A0A517XR60_9BACT|nr:PSD1 and planctomycete cytochrome C domain-containing protein [Urbifossiella limnaea]QDU20000.1 Planctomycete cytochrome C [Urbifossiella limnaea]